MIALDKRPGVRSIDVGDLAEWLCAKIMIFITGDDLQVEFSSDQIF